MNPGQQFVKHNSKRIDIRRRCDIVALATDLLRAGILRCHGLKTRLRPTHNLRIGSGIKNLRNPEIEQSNLCQIPPTKIGDENVPRLQVTMNDVSLVREADRLTNLLKKPKPVAD